ncbi:hypothetical protein [Leifsonia sp. ZF2019]|uniref:hypothetical protein n=1 Tax=Leifsonia sp. ZF2019 TaxID=2781978 RepID=UPI001CC19823|nr:hypothetical protein [Leifsonia sp. ZF2019]
MANTTWAQGMEHGWIGHPTRTVDGGQPRRRRRFVLSDWLPSAIAARGGTPSRETDRALSDLRAAQDAQRR